ncbi:MAG: hypothetical protein K6F76_03445 [Clostridiales bacterium]|nr:hypothetical protein [Clostridiales bacterium]
MKKLIIFVSFLLTVIISLYCTPVSAGAIYSLSAPELPIKGDADRDGKITMSDVTLMQRHIALFKGAQLCEDCCNVYKTGDISAEFDMVDITCVQKYLAYIIDNNSICGVRQGCKCRLENTIFNEPSDQQKSAIKIAYLESISSREQYEESDVKVLDYYGTMSDSSMLVKCSLDGMSLPIYGSMMIGKYTYQYPSSNACVFLYKDNKYFSIRNAYLNKTIDDKVLTEIAQTLGFYESDLVIKYNAQTSFMQVLREKYDEAEINIRDISYEIVAEIAEETDYGKFNYLLIHAQNSTPTIKFENITEQIGEYNFTHPNNEVYFLIDDGTCQSQEIIGCSEIMAEKIAKLLKLK